MKKIEKAESANAVREFGTKLATEPCANCKETVKECACMRNICHKCQKPVGNITFTICDECWDIEFPPAT